MTVNDLLLALATADRDAKVLLVYSKKGQDDVAFTVEGVGDQNSQNHDWLKYHEDFVGKPTFILQIK